jgi:lysophospholipase L1-like esterase
VACAAPAKALGLGHLPSQLRLRIAQGRPIKIVAIGSSSTFGAGASTPAASYPSRLEAELKARLPGLPITVINKGVNGEEASDMVARFAADVIEEAPDLVVWQVGSNSVLRDHPTPAAVIRAGIEQLKVSGTDVILMNTQYAPKILVKPEAQHAVDVILATARDEDIGLFDRFAVMRHWRETEKLPFEQFVTQDGLHMNDWGYACVAKLLADAILDGVKPPVMAATAASAALKR